jgi:hypothetical protein
MPSNLGFNDNLNSLWKGLERPSRAANSAMQVMDASELPNFSRHNIPKREKIYQMTNKFTKWP